MPPDISAKLFRTDLSLSWFFGAWCREHAAHDFIVAGCKPDIACVG